MRPPLARAVGAAAALVLLLCLAAAPAAETAAPTLPLRVLRRLPHDPAAFTEGLALFRGALFESTGLYGESSVRRLDPATGRALARKALPAEFFGEGLALCPEGRGARLVVLTWHEGVLLTLDPATLSETGRRPLRGEGWGLACRGAGRERELVLSDGSATLRWLDARTLAETGRTLKVTHAGRPVVRLNELEWVNGWLLANIWQEDRVAVIDPATGKVAAWLDLAPLRRALPADSAGAEAANGLAFDEGAGELYLTGKRWPVLFVAELPALLRRPPGR